MGNLTGVALVAAAIAMGLASGTPDQLPPTRAGPALSFPAIQVVDPGSRTEDR